VRVAAVTPELRVADVAHNTQAILAALADAAAQGCSLALFPELAVTGYTCADLFYQSLLRDQARAALRPLAQATKRLGLGAVDGLPLEVAGKLYNCAAFLGEGAVLGIVPKTYLPTTQEYYEERWFSSSARLSSRLSRPTWVACEGLRPGDQGPWDSRHMTPSIATLNTSKATN
jgi:NAD+ synthase (glutamine-hydrolysing)